MARKSIRFKDTQIMTLKEVARYLGVHEMTIYKIINEGKMPAFKLGGQWRFKKDVLDDWILRQMNNRKKLKRGAAHA